MPFHSNIIFNKISQFKVQILWSIALILFVCFTYFVVTNAARPSHGFATYYTASRLLIEGEDVSKFYNDDWFSSHVEEYVPGIYEIYHVNMPTTLFITLPIAVFDYKTARVIWIIFNLTLLVVVVFFIIKQFKFRETWIPLVLIILLSFQPLYANISYGQVYIFIFCLLILAWFAFSSDREEWLGLLIGLIFILKTTTFVLWILLLVQKKWKGLSWTFLTVLLLFIISLPWVGIGSWYAYGEKLVTYSSNHSSSVTAYQTIHSFFHHLTVYNQQWNPEPVFNLPFLGKSLSIIVSLFILTITAVSAYKFNNSNLSFGAFIIAGVILSPVSLDYHYVLLLIPVFILINWLRQNQSVILWTCFIIFFVFIAAEIPYTSPKVTGGVWAIFAYPKLYGAIGFWGLTLMASYRSRVIV